MAQKSSSKEAIPIEKLGRLIREKRKAESLTLEDVANETGVSTSTISRLERLFPGVKNKNITPDTRTLTALTRWLGVPTVHDTVSQKSTPDILEVYLRADPRLDHKAAEVLGEMFRLAYDQVAKSIETDPEGDVDETNTKR